MTDENPVVVNSSPLADQLKSDLRSAVLILSGVGLLSKYLPPEAAAFIKSDDFIPLASAILGALTVLWSQLEVRLRKRTLVAAANAAPDTKFVVVDPVEK